MLHSIATAGAEVRERERKLAAKDSIRQDLINTNYCCVMILSLHYSHQIIIINKCTELIN